jgi:aminopeptidase
MGETLYDENVGWTYGNTHVAIGFSFEDASKESLAHLNEQQRLERWFNQSAEHIDIISTTDRKVTAFLEDGSEKVIYENGQFQV